MTIMTEFKLIYLTKIQVLECLDLRINESQILDCGKCDFRLLKIGL